MGEYRCFCCGYKTLPERGEFEICPVCFWEDDVYIDFSKDPVESLYSHGTPPMEDLLDIPSGANHGLTLRQGQENYRAFGACEEAMLPHVRRPRKSEE